MLSTQQLADASAFVRQGIANVANAQKPFTPQPVSAPPTLVSLAGAFNVQFGAEPGDYRDVSLVKADSSILLQIPYIGGLAQQITLSPTPPAVAKLEAVVTGAFVHEVVHLVQRKQNPASFAAALAQQRAFAIQRQAGTVSAVDWLDGYYDSPEELACHAEQLAAEVFLVQGSGLLHQNFAAAAATAPVYTRIGATDRLDWLNTTSRQIFTWKQTWISLAWQIYSGW